jgi:REP element-mobilizing transposase RayT
MARGIEGRDIFADDNDRERFLSFLALGLKRTGYVCYAWALMKNHYHLVLRSSEAHLSALMRPLNASYAQAYSKAHNRRGYLFQDRYKSLLTQDQGYVEQLICYVHTNPLRAGVCRSLAELSVYPWTGHAVLMGNRDAPFQDTWPVLQRFGRSIEDGRRGYAEHIVNAMKKPDAYFAGFRKANNDRSQSEPGVYVIGDPEFVRNVLKKDRDKKLRIARHLLERTTIDELAARFACALKLGKIELLCRARGNSRSAARKVFAYLCHREYGFSIVEIAHYLGCTHSPVSLAVRQGEEIAKTKEFANVLIALRPHDRKE